ncbi:MAG: CotH kinase family protein [Spirochaetia bacterium]|nr:CotH kinase family protein [Spirochaetia bacterium]
MRFVYRTSFLYSILLFFILSLSACGEFVGMEDDDTDTTGVEKVQIFIPQDKLYWLDSSVVNNRYTQCVLEKGKWRGDAVIKVRGNTSRGNHKKSFGLKIDGCKYMLERGQENGGIYNRIVMRAYQLAGVPACDIESVGLFINDSYIGCYNFITYYQEKILKGELYKCRFHDSDLMVDNQPLRDKTKKEYPDDGNFSNLELLIIAATKYTDADWNLFVNKNVDIEEVASYMAVHDFFTVVDTRGANFYINYYKKFRLIPWDNECCMLKARSAFTLCDDNKLIKQFAAVPEVKEAYNRRMQDLFTGGGDTCILDQLQGEAATMFDNLATAMESDPEYGMSKQKFMAEKAYVLNYLDKNTGRAADGDRLILY